MKKYFKQVASFDTINIKQELKDTNLWNWLNIRKAFYGSKHNSVDDIVLRFQSVQGKFKVKNFFDTEECSDFFVQQYLPHTMEVIKQLTKGFSVGRIVIAKLKAGGIIDSHIDEGLYHKNYSRYHMVVDTNKEVVFTCLDEQQHMNEGSIWWFNNRVTHSVINNGITDRTHIVLDIKR